MKRTRRILTDSDKKTLELEEHHDALTEFDSESSTEHIAKPFKESLKSESLSVKVNGKNETALLKSLQKSETNQDQNVTLSQAKALGLLKLKDEKIPKSELIIHKKKIEEVESWMKIVLLKNEHGNSRSHYPRTLILSGPPGSGKSTLINSLAAHFQCELLEWKYPSDKSQFYVLEDLSQFLKEACYSNLVVGTPNKIFILLDDIPFVGGLTSKQNQLFDILRNTAQITVLPLIIILPESAKHSASLMMNQHEFDRSPHIKQINLNPMPPGVLQRAVRKRAEDVGLVISKSDIEYICTSSGGDLRSAFLSLSLQSLQLSKASHQETEASNEKKRRKILPQVAPLELWSGIGRDTSPGIFHAIGKILMAKREADNTLRESPEEIIEPLIDDSRKFLNILHHNYISFFGDLDDVASGAEALSRADTLLRWRQDEATLRSLRENACIQTARGLMFSNQKKAESAWRPLSTQNTKIMDEIIRQTDEYRYSVFSASSAPDLRRRVVHLDLVPYMQKIYGIQALQNQKRVAQQTEWEEIFEEDETDLIEEFD